MELWLFTPVRSRDLETDEVYNFQCCHTTRSLCFMRKCIAKGATSKCNLVTVKALLSSGGWLVTEGPYFRKGTYC